MNCGISYLYQIWMNRKNANTRQHTSLSCWFLQGNMCLGLECGGIVTCISHGGVTGVLEFRSNSHFQPFNHALKFHQKFGELQATTETSILFSTTLKTGPLGKEKNAPPKSPMPQSLLVETGKLVELFLFKTISGLHFPKEQTNKFGV